MTQTSDEVHRGGKPTSAFPPPPTFLNEPGRLTDVGAAQRGRRSEALPPGSAP